MKAREGQMRLILGVVVMAMVIGWSGSARGQSFHTPPQSPLGNCIACVLGSFFSPYGYNSVFGAFCDPLCNLTVGPGPGPIDGHVAVCTISVHCYQDDAPSPYTTVSCSSDVQNGCTGGAPGSCGDKVCGGTCKH